MAVLKLDKNGHFCMDDTKFYNPNENTKSHMSNCNSDSEVSFELTADEAVRTGASKSATVSQKMTTPNLFSQPQDQKFKSRKFINPDGTVTRKRRKRKVQRQKTIKITDPKTGQDLDLDQALQQEVIKAATYRQLKFISTQSLPRSRTF